MSLVDEFLESQWFLAVLSNFALLTTIGLFLTGAEICWRIHNKQTTDGISGAPFHMGLVSGNLWFQYGILKRDIVVTRVNTVSVILYTLYIIYYWKKTTYPAKKLQNRLIISEVVFLLSVFFYTHRPEAALHEVLTFLGFLCMSFNIVTVASPLVSLREVIRTRSTESLPLPLCIANLVVTSEWLLYGILVNDFYIKVPNAIAVVISLAQISPFMIYPRKRKTSYVREE